MGNKNESTRITLAAVNNCVGRIFSAGGAKVVRPERENYTVFAICACQQCGQEHRLTVRKLGDMLRYPNERLWQCAAAACPSRNNAPAKPQLESEHLRFIAEKEFADKRAQPVPMELQKSYSRIFRAFGLTVNGVDETKHPDFFTGRVFYAMPVATQKAWIEWADKIIAADAEQKKQAQRLAPLRQGYARLKQALEHIQKPDELPSFETYVGYTDEERTNLAAYSKDVLVG